MEKIDLGLPSETKWASCNIGARKPTEFSYYFAWGDSYPKDDYVENTSKTYDMGLYTLMDLLDKRNVLLDFFDAGADILSNGWRVPSIEQALV